MFRAVIQVPRPSDRIDGQAACAQTEPNARKNRDLLAAGVEGRTGHECTHLLALRARIGGAVEGVVSAPETEPNRVRK